MLALLPPLALNVTDTTALLAAAAVLITAVVAVAMLGPNRSGKALENAEREIRLAWASADRAYAERDALRAERDDVRQELAVSHAHLEAMTRDRDHLIARVLAAGLELE